MTSINWAFLFPKGYMESYKFIEIYQKKSLTNDALIQVTREETKLREIIKINFQKHFNLLFHNAEKWPNIV